MIRLLLLDDHPVVSCGMAARYEAMTEFAVVGTAATFGDAIRIARSSQIDVAIVDVQLDTMLTPRQVAALTERCRVVLFSAHCGAAWVRQLIAAGAAAVVDKAVPLDELDATVRAVHAGRMPPKQQVRESRTTHDLLSERERHVYRALAGCKTPKEVAATLGIARSTVYCHLESIRRKLGVETLHEVIVRACAELAGERS